MEICRFEAFLEAINVLTKSQCAQILRLLTTIIDQGRAAEIIEEAVAGTLHCPRCQGKTLYRHGAKSGLQRFRCRDCGRTFNSLTGTPLARLRHKDKWRDYGKCVLASNTVRKAASSVAVAKNTSLRWRHRFLSSTKDDRPSCLSGIAEVSETFFARIAKGRTRSVALSAQAGRQGKQARHFA